MRTACRYIMLLGSKIDFFILFPIVSLAASSPRFNFRLSPLSLLVRPGYRCRALIRTQPGPLKIPVFINFRPARERPVQLLDWESISDQLLINYATRSVKTIQIRRDKFISWVKLTNHPKLVEYKFSAIFHFCISLL